MERVREQLLELVKASLWGTSPSSELFMGDVDWPKLLNEAQKQALLGQTYIQFERLEARPPKGIMLRLHSLTTLNRKMHSKQLQVLDTITKRLQSIGIERPVLLKGIGVSANYLDPTTRQCGDIDLYVGKEHYDKACEAAKSWSESITDKHSMSRKHYHFTFEGIPIEIHRIVITSNNIMHHASHFDTWCVEALEGDKLRHESIEGVEVYLPPYNFDAIYIFFHAWNHFCSYGIAFRQICDWCRYLESHKANIDRTQLEADLKYFGLIRPWSYFAAVAIKLLALDPACLVGFDESQKWHTDKVAQRIWSGGNFGFYGGKHASGKGINIFVRKFINFFSLFHSFGYLHSIDPRYSYNFLFRTPLNSIKFNIFELYYKITGK